MVTLYTAFGIWLGWNARNKKDRIMHVLHKISFGQFGYEGINPVQKEETK